MLNVTKVSPVAKTLLALVCGFASSAAFAFDFSAADAAFEKRTDAEQAEKALGLYSDALSQTSGSEKLYAVEQLGRLDYYLGNKAPESDTEARKKIFQRCLDNVETINPSAFGSDTPQYRYFKGVCLANWAKANGILKSLEQAGELIENIETGRKLDETYEGGGFYRLGVAVYLNLPPLAGGDVNKAWDYYQKTIASPAYSGSKTPDTDSGNYHFAAYLYGAQVAAKRGDKAGAKAIGQEAIERIEGGDLPVGREPETLLVKKEIEDFLKTLD